MKQETRLTTGNNRVLSAFDAVSWSAVLAGVALALAIQLMLSVLGVGIGASTIHPQTEQSPLSGIGIGGAIWLLGSSVIAMYIGGWIAGRFSKATRRSTGTVHGTMTWAATVLVAVYFLSSAVGGLISGSASLLGSVVATTTQVAASSPQVSDEVKQALRQRGIDIDSITQQAQDPQNQAQAAQQARQAGEKIVGGVSMAGILGFFALLIGLVAASLGGRNGVPRTAPVEVPEARQAA